MAGFTPVRPLSHLISFPQTDFLDHRDEASRTPTLLYVQIISKCKCPYLAEYIKGCILCNVLNSIELPETMQYLLNSWFVTKIIILNQNHTYILALFIIKTFVTNLTMLYYFANNWAFSIFLEWGKVMFSAKLIYSILLFA